MENGIKKHKKVWISIIIFICILLGIYLKISSYFSNHFYFKTIINCIDVSDKTVEGAEEEILSKSEVYTLELEGRYDMKEQIHGSDINLKYDLSTKIKELKEKQNPFGWIFMIFGTRDYKIYDVITYDEELLKNNIEKMSYFNSNSIIEPKNPSFEYTDSGYKIIDEVYGNKLNKDILYEHIRSSILSGETKINLESINCYENPRYTSNSKEVAKAKDTLDKYIDSTVTYTFGDRTEILDKSIIHKWIKVDKNLEVILDEKEVGDYVEKLANTYNTAGKVREFVTSLGTKTKIGGGYYGWIIDNSKEVKKLIEIIKEGESITREPIYKQKAVSRNINDIGNTYIEINLTNQHLWFYKDGVLIVQGDVVTGNVSRGSPTPSGIYQLNYKQKDATLKGENYTSPVTFWMPFYGNIGIHDASWRYSFGGKIYMTNGSHGCVNAPYYLANKIFNNIEEGTPIICY